MAKYSSLSNYMARPYPLASGIISCLINDCLSDYHSKWESADAVLTQSCNSNYLFDVAAQRLVVAWIVSSGRDGHTRDTSRMAGFPNSMGSLYHRGHAIPHRLGGGTDINLVLQLGSINIGAFRVLEREAQSAPGSIYFTYWLYGDGSSQVPAGVEQGLIRANRPVTIARHSN